MASDFFELLKRFVSNKVDFVIVGGFAGVVHGCTYVTQDMDVYFDFSVENLLGLQKALSDLHPVHRMATGRVELNLTEENCAQFKNLYLDTDIGQLDCLSSIDGIGSYQEVKKASISIEAEGLQIRVLSIEGLIESKKTLNRPRDEQAIIQLEAIKKIQEQEGIT